VKCWDFYLKLHQIQEHLLYLSGIEKTV
jgi:hypothetical protein